MMNTLEGIPEGGRDVEHNLEQYFHQKCCIWFINFYAFLSGANINAQTEETQETALTLACCGGFSEVADFLIKAGADIELGCSTPLMEASQEGHLELVKYLLAAGMWI